MPRQRKSRPGRKPQLPPNIHRKGGKKNLYGTIQFKGIRKWFSLGTPDVDEAQQVLQQKIDETWIDNLDGRDRVTFSRQFNYIFPRRWANLKSAAWQQQMHDNIVETLGDFYLDEVSEDWCWHYIATRREGGLRRSGVKHLPIGDGTINKEMAFVKRVMLTVDEDRVKMPKKKQIDQKGAPTDPIVKIKRSKSAELVTNPLRDEEEARELMAEMVPHARPVVLTAVMSGLRKENVMQLDIRDNILWNERQIRVKQKGDRDHLIGMSDDLYKLLRDVCGERTRGPVFVFGINGCDCQYCTPVNQRTGKPHKKYKAGERITSIRTTFETARNRIGRPDLRFHDLRHTLGTWLNSRGIDINVIKDVLGHRDIATTQRYLHVGIDVGRKALDDKLNFNLSAPRK